MKLFYILLFTLFLHEVSSASCLIIDDDVPSYYTNILAEKTKLINSDKTSSFSFVFITDTHTNANRMVSPFLIRNILEHTNISKVIWGGDAICAFGNNSDIDVQWKKQLVFDSLVSKVGQLYKLRGNHDFTIKESKVSSKGATFSQQKTAQWLFMNHPNDVIRNGADPNACYYFFDDKRAHVRYVVFDTTDSVRGEDVPWGTVYGVHDVQLKWVADSAIATVPRGYGLVFLSHVPLTDTTGTWHVVLSNIKEIVDAAALHTSGKIGSVNYDFSALEDVKVLMCLSGHNHQDMQTFCNGVVHVVTASDAAYDDYKADPFVMDLTGRKKGTVNEHCFDCVTINKKNGLIKMYRIGVGGDRVFHTKPLSYRIGKRKRLKTSLRDNVEWHSYNASGNKYDGKWTLFNDIVSVDNHGNVTCQKTGESVVLAVDKKGNKEFYNIIVKM